MRCVFSESLNGSTLVLSGVSAPARPSPFARPWATVSAVVHDLVTTVFPADCRLCHDPLHRAGSSPVCPACIARVRPQQRASPLALCTLCGEALGMESDRFATQLRAVNDEALRCTACRLAPPPFDQAVAYAIYEDEVRELIHLLKYEHMRAVAGPLGLRLADAITTLTLTGEVDVVAVPLFPGKERQRGYNQAVLLADSAIAHLRRRGKTRFRAKQSLLRRTRDTESQFALTARNRRLNLRGAFAVSMDAALSGRTVLLIDDIYTTGATARECTRVLRRAGAARVFVATVSRAQPERAELWENATTWTDPVTTTSQEPQPIQ